LIKVTLSKKQWGYRTKCDKRKLCYTSHVKDPKSVWPILRLKITCRRKWAWMRILKPDHGMLV